MAARASSHTTSPTADDAGWRRLNLVFMLNTSTRPLTTEEIVTDSDLGYGSDNLDSEMRKFRRDRKALASCGIVIRNMQPEGSSETETGLWAIDRTSTFAATDELSLDELDLVIDALTKHLAIPQNPLSTPLASALKKAQIVRAVRSGERATSTFDAPGCTPDPIVEAVWQAYTTKRALKVSYCDAKGTESQRTIRIYGLFMQNGTTYLTGLDDASGQIRTFRIDRIKRAWRPQGRYVVPESFDVRAYRFLPFDFSDEAPVDAVVQFPATSTEAERAAITCGRGTITHEADDTWTWHIEARSLDAMARYLLGHARDNIVPIAPDALVDTWNTLCNKAVCAHEN